MAATKALGRKKTSSERNRTPRALAARGGRIRLRTLVFIRWIAVLGQTATLLVVHAGLGFELPIVPAVGTIAASALVNLYAAFGHRDRVWLDDTRAAGYLAFDLCQLLILLGLTGGLSNPFSMLVLAPVVVSASALSRRSTVLLTLLGMAGISALAFWHLPLPWLEPGLTLPWIYVAGIWGALAISMIFTTAYVSSLALESRRMADALSATQFALAREQRLSALGGLAAAAAHELGTPLATIAVVTRELEHDLGANLPADSPEREDLTLLRTESDRCRQILAELANRPEEEDSPYHRLPLSALIEAAAAPYAHEGKTLTIRLAAGEGDGTETEADQPVVPRSAEVLHGLRNLVQNALQFARQRVEVTLAWDDATVRIAIHDDGPGFEDAVLAQLGEPYLSTGGRDRRGSDEHMGLGVFIAETLLAHSGARLEFRNHPDGGAEVVIRWQRHQLEGARTQT